MFFVSLQACASEHVAYHQGPDDCAVWLFFEDSDQMASDRPTVLQLVHEGTATAGDLIG